MSRAGKMAPMVKAPAAILDDLNVIARSHMIKGKNGLPQAVP